MFPRKILVATDGSAEAGRATEAASDLPKRAKAELHVVHVWHDVPGFTHDFVKRKLKRQGQQRLDEGGLRGGRGGREDPGYRGTGATVAEAHLRGGRTSNEVIALSEEIGPGLLIVGICGLGTVQRILMGSQSEETVHHARGVPGLVLRGEGDVWPPERLLTGEGEDFSDDSRARPGSSRRASAPSMAPGAPDIHPPPDLPEVPPGKTRFTVQDNLTDMRGRKEEEDLQRRAGAPASSRPSSADARRPSSPGATPPPSS